jgi:hypothetical protein
MMRYLLAVVAALMLAGCAVVPVPVPGVGVGVGSPVYRSGYPYHRYPYGGYPYGGYRYPYGRPYGYGW